MHAPLEFHAKRYENVHQMLTQLLPFAGIATIVVMQLSLFGALIALSSLHRACDRYTTLDDPPVHSSKVARWLGLSAMLGVPLIFLILWIILLLAMR